MSKKKSLQDVVDREKRLRRLESMLLTGITNQTQLGAAFGISQQEVSAMIKEIKRRWRQASKDDVDTLRIRRIKQIENIAQQALVSYQRSRCDIEEITTHERRCRSCRGKGKVKPKESFFDDGGKKGELEECEDCGGTGRLTTEVIKTKGQAGDSSFLRVAKECFLECARLEGSAPSNSAMALRKVASELGDGQISQEIEEIYLEGPIDVILKAKAVLEEIRQRQKSGEITEVIDEPVKSKRLNNTAIVDDMNDVEDVEEGNGDEDEEE